MTPTSLECRQDEPRSADRSSIYLAAALYCDGASSPVKIRNISATGALLEGVAVPSPGTLVQLVRGGLIVHGLVIWTSDGRCGLKFSGSIDVQNWRAGLAHAEQQRVDEVVKLVKAGAVPLPVPPLGHLPQRNDPEESAARLSDDLRIVSALLDKLGEELASDMEIVTGHGPALQNLDIAMQVISAVATMMDSDGELDLEMIKLAALRRSADQALQRGN